VALARAVEVYTRRLAERGRRTILEEFARVSSYARNKRVRVEHGGEVLEGVTDGLDPSGFLIVQTGDGSRRIVLAGGVRPA
jgi:BirA family biotin operon repressor/biotin-[acetyl-CoA-carboxylase] ligase